MTSYRYAVEIFVNHKFKVYKDKDYKGYSSLAKAHDCVVRNLPKSVKSAFARVYRHRSGMTPTKDSQWSLTETIRYLESERKYLVEKGIREVPYIKMYFLDPKSGRLVLPPSEPKSEEEYKVEVYGNTMIDKTISSTVTASVAGQTPFVFIPVRNRARLKAIDTLRKYGGDYALIRYRVGSGSLSEWVDAEQIFLNKRVWSYVTRLYLPVSGYPRDAFAQYSVDGKTGEIIGKIEW